MRGALSILGGGSLNESPAAVTGQPWWIPDLFYNLQGKAAPDAVYAVNQSNNLSTAAATINPITGQPVPAAVQYAAGTSGAAGQALQQAQAQPTGSPIADSLQSLLSSVVGTGSAPSGSGFPWATVALFAALGLGGYLVYKVVVK